MNKELRDEIISYLREKEFEDSRASRLIEKLLVEEIEEVFAWCLKDFKKPNVVEFICAAAYNVEIKNFMYENFDDIVFIYATVQKLIDEVDVTAQNGNKE